MDQPSVVGEWSDVGQIISRRDILPGEKVIAHAFADDTGEKLESVELTPQGNEFSQFRWPYYFAGLINRQAKYMRAGVLGIDGVFKGEMSGYNNKLWSKDKNVRLFTTISDLDNWIEVETLRSAGDLSSDGTGGVEVQVQSAGDKQPCETLIFRPGVDRHQQYRWEADLCRFINEKSLFIRAGEKPLGTQLFACLGSSSRNKFWVPVGSRLQVSYKTVVLEKIPVANDWSEVGNISSTRDVLPGEKVIAYAFANDTGVELENVKLPPLNQKYGQYKWPYDFAGLINRQAKYMRAGVRGADGTFKGEWSGYTNKLWSKDKNVRLFTTISDLENWIDVETLRSAGDLSSDGTGGVEVLVQSAGAKKPCETWIFRPGEDRHQQYHWEIDLCRYINENSLFIRAGEKNSNTQLFECLGSNSRNTFWVPVGSRLQVSYKAVVLEKIPVANDWSEVGTISSTRDVLPGEKIIAYAFANDAGVELENVKLPVQDQKYGQYKWPYDFTGLINRKAKYMRAGVRGADGTFKGEWSGYTNKLWSKDKNVRLFTTISDLENWIDVETLRSTGDLSSDGTGGVEVQVHSVGAKKPCETLIFRPRVDRHQQYRWEIDLCRYINENSLFIRAGEKNSNTQLFECLGSNSRNTFWVPVGSRLQVSYKIVVLEKIPAANNWSIVGNISSSRNVLSGEKVIAFAFADDTGIELERVELTPRGEESPRYKWPYDFAALINRQAKHMRAGVQGADGTFKGEWSGYTNKLWSKDQNVRLFTTISDLGNWTEVATLRSTKGLLADGQGSVVVQVQSADGKRVYETLPYRPGVDRHQQYRWEADLCRFINQNSLFIRAGEKNSDNQLFECLGSNSRNKFWVPVGSGLQVSYKIIEAPVSKPMASLKNGDNDVLPDMSGFESDSLGTADNSWFSPGYLLADRDLADGEKLRAWLINSADGKSVDYVEFIAAASNRSKSKWPGAFAKAINAKARQMRAGGWSDDGQFSALEKSATSAGFAGQTPAFKAGINRLWHYGDGNRIFTTAAFRTNWVQALSLDNYGLNATDTFCVQVRDITSQYLYRTYLFTPDAKKPLSTRTLCEEINRDARMLRAGIWNTKTSLIAPGDKNNALWIPQCSDLAVTLMAVNWWSQITVDATRDLQDGESIYCYLWDDFSSFELVPPLRFTPKTAAQRNKNAWLRAWAAAIKASPLAGYVRLGSNASGSSDPGENATQATLWQIGAPLRVFTTEPSPNNWLSATGPLADLYENNKTAVKIELRNGLTQGLLQAITFTPSETVTKASDKDLWLREFYQYLVSQFASLAYVRVGKTADIKGEDLSGPVPAPMRVWVPRGSGIVVGVERASSSAGAVAPVPGKPEMIKTSDLEYTFTARIAEYSLVATVIALASTKYAMSDYSLKFVSEIWLRPELEASVNEIFKSKLKPIFNSVIPHAEEWSDPGSDYQKSFSIIVVDFMKYQSVQLLLGGVWGQRIEKLSHDTEVQKCISTYEADLRPVYDHIFSRNSIWRANNLWSIKGAPWMAVFDELSAGNQLIVYGAPSVLLLALSLQAVANRIRVLSISSLPEYLSKVVYSRLDDLFYEKVYVKIGIVIDFYVPDDAVFNEPYVVGRIGQVSPDSLWPSGRALTMSFRKNKLTIPDSPLCGDYGNTYRSEVFDVSGQNTNGVDPRTGLFNAHYPLALLMGMEGKGPLCDLTLHYSALRANEAGLGDGWAFNFSSYETRSRLITLSTGQTIELTTEDIAKLRTKAAVNNRSCRISATFLADGDPMVTDGIKTLTLEFPSGAKEVLSLPAGDQEEPYAETVKTILAKLNEAKNQIYNTKDQSKPQRNSTAGIVQEIFSWVVLPVGAGITANNTIRYNAAWKEWDEAWAEKLPELLGPIDKEIAYWQRESRQLLPLTLTSATNGSLQLQWERRKGQFLLTKVWSNGKTLLTGRYAPLADADGNKVSEVTFSVWPDTEEAYNVKLRLHNYLLQSIVRSETSVGVLQKVRYGYSGDPTLDRVLTSIEESDGSLEVVFYERAAMKFPSGLMNKPPLPRVTRHIVQPGVDQASLITQWAYSSNNYLGANSSQSFSRLDDAAVKEGAKYVYDSTATDTDGIVITRTWNGLHLQLKEQEAAPSGVGKTTEWSFASVDPASALFGLVTSIKTTYQEAELARESTK